MSVLLLQVRHAVKHFGRGRTRVAALQGLSLRVDEGEVVGLVGPNGAGKTTLLTVAAGLVRLTAGAVTVDGAAPASRAAARCLGFAPQQPYYPLALTVRDTLEYAARIHGGPSERRAWIGEAVELAGLEPVLGRRSLQLSRGWSHRLALALAVFGGRRIALLDETLEGVDPIARRRITRALRERVGRGLALVVASHDLLTLERLVDRVVVMRAGKIRLDTVTEGASETRVVEVALEDPLDPVPPAMAIRLPAYERTPQGFRVALGAGDSLEEVLDLCRRHRIRVRATEVAHHQLEDRVLAALESPLSP